MSSSVSRRMPLSVIYCLMTCLQLTWTYDLRLPNFVTESGGGLTQPEKMTLFQQKKNFSLVFIPPNLQSKIKPLENLPSYTICSKKNGNYEYILCPIAETNTQIERFCCGEVGTQWCCNEQTFRAGIRVITPELPISPSILIGVALATLLAMAVISLFTYSRFVGDQRAKESELATLTYERPQSRTSHASVAGVASQPPCGQLLSSESSRRSQSRGV